MNVLVTGGAGFIGAHVARLLVAAGYNVTVLDDLSGGRRDNVPDGAEFVHGSVVDHEFLSGLFDSGSFDYVFHLAAYAAEGLSHHIRRFNYDNNVSGSASLISLSIEHQIKHFVFASSIAVYGRALSPVDETIRPDPIDPYGIAKLAVEQDLAAAREYFGLRYTVFRPHNVYGEGQNTGDRYRNVVGIFMNQALSGQPFSVFGDGEQQRAFSYIADVAPLFVQAIRSDGTDGKTFNVGAESPTSVLHLAHMVAATMGVEPEIEFLPARNEVNDIWASHSLASSTFDMPHPTPLEIGLGRMAGWVKSIGRRQLSRFGKIEVTRNLPAGWEVEKE